VPDFFELINASFDEEDASKEEQKTEADANATFHQVRSR
jgi:hypothetical protein